MTNFRDNTIKEIIRIEGGYSNDKNDSGGETKYGIAKKSHPNIDIKNLTKSDATKIYIDMYWNSIRGDDLTAISTLIANEVFDTAVNLGVNRASKILQRNLNVFNNRQEYYNDILVDGDIGNATIVTLQSYARKRFNDGGEEVLHKMLNCLQGAFYVDLCERREKDEKYMFGWAKNRT
jgi:lysozyme family protein